VQSELVENYYYPDKNDSLTKTFISAKQPFDGYWAKSEQFILDRMKNFVLTHTGSKINAWFLDVGCGTGRLLPEFESFFHKMLAIDPDKYLLEIAKDTVKKHGLSRKVTFQHTSIEKLEWKERSIDVILCSHVLQHVHTDSLTNMLVKLEQLLENGGLLFITTCYSRKDYDFYTKMYLKNHGVVEEGIKKEKFNFLICNEKKILPIHFFSKKNIFKMLRDLHFEMLGFKSFHVLNRMSLLDCIVFRDKLVNFFPFLQSRLGRDMFIVCRKL
jgi:2-polyprenyl-3-methyl-5-hydroxy-6-metoxy-1,4-benzoquinol methylase